MFVAFSGKLNFIWNFLHFSNSKNNNCCSNCNYLQKYGVLITYGLFSGMGSLQNLNRSGSSLVQLSRAAVVANQSSLAPGSGNPSLMGFNSAVGGGRITPTSSGSAASVSGNLTDYIMTKTELLYPKNGVIGSNGFHLQ